MKHRGLESGKRYRLSPHPTSSRYLLRSSPHDAVCKGLNELGFCACAQPTEFRCSKVQVRFAAEEIRRQGLRYASSTRVRNQ
jgi:hypothetical protein